MSSNRFDDFRLVLTAPDCPQLISDDFCSRSFLGYDPAADRLVEFRVAGELPSPAERLRHERRVQRWAKVCHPGIASALGWGEWDDSPVVVSEFVDGEPLLQYAHRVGQLPAELALSIALQVCDVVALAAEYDWLAPLGFNDFAVDYDERDCLRVRLFNIGLFRGNSSVSAQDAARLWFRRLAVLLDGLRRGDIDPDEDVFDRRVEEQMPEAGSVAKFFGFRTTLSAPSGKVSELMRTLRAGLLTVSGVNEPGAAKSYGFRPRARWAPMGLLTKRIYGERIAGSFRDDLLPPHRSEEESPGNGEFDSWLDSPLAQNWWRPPHRLYGRLAEKHLGVERGTEVQVQLLPPANYVPGYDQNVPISSLQNPQLREHRGVVKLFAANWDEELTYTLEEPLDGFRLCDWAARHEDLPLHEVAEVMLELSQALRSLEAVMPKDCQWPINPWVVWVQFGGEHEAGRARDQCHRGAQSNSALRVSHKSEWPDHSLKIRLGPSWERMTLAESGVWSAVRQEFARAFDSQSGAGHLPNTRDAIIDFLTLTVWLAQYETLAIKLRSAPPLSGSAAEVVRENLLVKWLSDRLPKLVEDGHTGRQLVFHELLAGYRAAAL